MFKIILNKESAIVLLRCLEGSGSRITHSEEQSGIGAIIDQNVWHLREQLCSGLCKEILEELATCKRVNQNTN